MRRFENRSLASGLGSLDCFTTSVFVHLARFVDFTADDESVDRDAIHHHAKQFDGNGVSRCVV